jgi:hypothetical protein
MPISQFLMNNYAKTIEKTDIYAGFLHKVGFWSYWPDLNLWRPFKIPLFIRLSAFIHQLCANLIFYDLYIPLTAFYII